VTYITIDYTQSNHLKLTPLSSEVLKKGRKVQLFEYQKKKAAPVKQPKIIEVEDDLFEIIRKWRAGQARQQGIPAYTILHDKTLRELSSTKPTDINQLEDIDGIGKAKKAKYGEAIVKMIQEYIEHN